MNIHPDDPKWTAYVLGELCDAERKEVEQEMESSAEARELVREIRTATMLLKDELAKEPGLTMSIEQRRAVRAALGPKPSFWKNRWRVAGLAAAAAAVAVVIARTGPGTQPVEAPAQAFLSVPPPPGGTPVRPPSRQPAVTPPQEFDRSSADAVPQRQADAEAATSGLKAGKEQQETPMSDALADRSKDGDGALQQQKAQAGSGRNGVLAGVLGGALSTQAETAAAPPPPPPPPGALAPGVRAKQFAPSNNLAVEEARASAAGEAIARAVPPAAPDERRREFNTETYDRVVDNPFKAVAQDPLATFSIDVDTASYANMRRFLNMNQLPPRDSVRIEELINYFNYDYAQPSGKHPIGVYTELAAAPWKSDHKLVRIAVKARDVDMARRPPSNLVFLIDVSGSMMPPERLPLLKSALKLLVDKLGENDHVAIVVYAGNSGLVLPSTSGDRKEQISQALDRLEAGGSTNGAAGIQLAYDTAIRNFVKGGVNRVILCTDGDFNVGVTNQGDLTRLIEDKAQSGVFLSVLGFGMGNLKDSTMEKLADKGNGNYAYIDSLNEARKVLVEEMGGTLMTVAKDVKIQVDFNPAQVNAYRLIGYENRILQNQDFNDDTKDAGDMGAGQTVTALFEIVPRGVPIDLPAVDGSKYRQPAPETRESADRRANNSEVLTVRVRYKLPDANDSTRFDVPLSDRGNSFDAASTDYRFAAAVAEFGMILRDSPYKGQAGIARVLDIAEHSKGADKNGYRDEFIRLVRRARALKDLR